MDSREDSSTNESFGNDILLFPMLPLKQTIFVPRVVHTLTVYSLYSLDPWFHTDPR